MSSDRLMRIHSAEFQAMAERVVRVTELTSRLNVLPFEDEVGKTELFELILGRPLPARVTIYPPFHTDHGLHLDLAERVFINQNVPTVTVMVTSQPHSFRASVGPTTRASRDHH